MSNKNDMMQYFEDKQTPRLELAMLPRDPARTTGDVRKVLCSVFNYARKYPVKLEKFIEVLRWVTNFALTYQHLMLEAEKKKREEEQEKINSTNEV